MVSISEPALSKPAETMQKYTALASTKPNPVYMCASGTPMDSVTEVKIYLEQERENPVKIWGQWGLV